MAYLYLTLLLFFKTCILIWPYTCCVAENALELWRALRFQAAPSHLIYMVLGPELGPCAG